VIVVSETRYRGSGLQHNAGESCLFYGEIDRFGGWAIGGEPREPPSDQLLALHDQHCRAIHFLSRALHQAIKHARNTMGPVEAAKRINQSRHAGQLRSIDIAVHAGNSLSDPLFNVRVGGGACNLHLGESAVRLSVRLLRVGTGALRLGPSGLGIGTSSFRFGSGSSGIRTGGIDFDTGSVAIDTSGLGFGTYRVTLGPREVGFGASGFRVGVRPVRFAAGRVDVRAGFVDFGGGGLQVDARLVAFRVGLFDVCLRGAARGIQLLLGVRA